MDYINKFAHYLYEDSKIAKKMVCGMTSGGYWAWAAREVKLSEEPVT